MSGLPGGWRKKTASINPASIAAHVTANTAVTVQGVSTTDVVVAIPPSTIEQGLVLLTAWVSAANQITVRLHNATIGAVDGAALTWTFLVYQGDGDNPMVA